MQETRNKLIQAAITRIGSSIILAYALNSHRVADRVFRNVHADRDSTQPRGDQPSDCDDEGHDRTWAGGSSPID